MSDIPWFDLTEKHYYKDDTWGQRMRCASYDVGHDSDTVGERCKFIKNENGRFIPEEFAKILWQDPHIKELWNRYEEVN